MDKINAVITGVGGYVPDYVLTNDEISKMVDTTDEWIMGRIGIKERHILNEEGLGTSYMARKAAKQLMQAQRVIPMISIWSLSPLLLRTIVFLQRHLSCAKDWA